MFGKMAFRKIPAGNVVALALAAGFATALAAPAEAVICSHDVSTVNFDYEMDDIECTIDFGDVTDTLSSAATSPGLSASFRFAYGFFAQRYQATTGTNPQYQYNVFGTPVTTNTGTINAGATSASADLIVLSATEGQALNTAGSENNVGFGIGGVSADDLAGTINNGKRLEFMLQAPEGQREDGFKGPSAVRPITLQSIQMVSYRVGDLFSIEAYDIDGNLSGTQALAATVGRTDNAPVTSANVGESAELATYCLATAGIDEDGESTCTGVGLTGVRFQIVGIQLFVSTQVDSTGPDGGGFYGVRLREATFTYAGVIPLPGALIPALTGLAVIGGIGGLAARRRRLRETAA